jgi:hypothetical protein
MRPSNIHKNKWKFDVIPVPFIIIIAIINPVCYRYSRRIIEHGGLMNISDHPGVNAAFTAFATIIISIFMNIALCFLIIVFYNYMKRKKADKKTGL